MDFIDFFAGFTLVHAVPHLILGAWNRKMYSPFGMSPKANTLYSYFVIALSFGMLFYKYRLDVFKENGIYMGCLAGLLIYVLFASSMYRRTKSRV